jgi:hypothetical protein
MTASPSPGTAGVQQRAGDGEQSGTPVVPGRPSTPHHSDDVHHEKPLIRPAAIALLTSHAEYT